MDAFISGQPALYAVSGATTTAAAYSTAIPTIPGKSGKSGKSRLSGLSGLPWWRAGISTTARAAANFRGFAGQRRCAAGVAAQRRQQWRAATTHAAATAESTGAGGEWLGEHARRATLAAAAGCADERTAGLWPAASDDSAVAGRVRQPRRQRTLR